MGLCSTSGFTFADVCGDAADLPADHLLVKLLDVEGLHGEGQLPCQHGKHAHTSAHASANKDNIHFRHGQKNKLDLKFRWKNPHLNIPQYYIFHMREISAPDAFCDLESSV